MQVISQVRLSTFDGGKSYNGEVRVGDAYLRLTGEALRELLSAHKALGGTIRKFPARKVPVKNAERAARYGRKVGDLIEVTDYVSDRLRFDAVVGDGIVDEPRSVQLVNEFSVNAADLDLGDVVEVKVTAKPAAPAPTGADADDL